MEQQKIDDHEEEVFNVGVGEDKPQLGPKTVTVNGLKIESVEKDGKHIGNKLVLLVNHQDAAEEVQISGVKYLDAKEKVKNSGLWVKLDGDNKLAYHSATANLLRHYKVKALKDLKGIDVETCLDASNYLAIKAY